MKPRFDLIPPLGLTAAAEHLAVTAHKHPPTPDGREEWETLTPRRHLASALRHIWAYLRGERVDPDDGQHPLAAAACRCLMACDVDLRDAAPLHSHGAERSCNDQTPPGAAPTATRGLHPETGDLQMQDHPLTRAQQDEQTEGVILRLLLERHPAPLTRDEIHAGTAEPDTDKWGAGDATDRALRELVAYDLIRPIDGHFIATQAAVHASRLLPA